MLSESDAAIAANFFGFLIGGAIGGGLIWAGVTVFRTANEAAKRRAVKVVDQMPKWEMAMVRWNNLYYCARDDGIFDPEENIFVSTNQMIDYIYR